MTLIKPAATVLIVKEVELGIKILLVQRNTALKFASGFWVFPGGKIDAHETEQFPIELEAAKVAARREVKEECDLDVDINALNFFVHWTTPKNEKRRFSTYFFHALSVDEQKVTVDGSEILDHKWLDPKEAIQMAKNQEIALLPPTYVNIERIAHCTNYQQVNDEYAKVEPVYVTPTIGFKDNNAHCMYEGDAGFENGDPNTAGPRHRLVFNFKKGHYKFEYEDCPDHYPLNGITLNS